MNVDDFKLLADCRKNWTSRPTNHSLIGLQRSLNGLSLLSHNQVGDWQDIFLFFNEIRTESLNKDIQGTHGILSNEIGNPEDDSLDKGIQGEREIIEEDKSNENIEIHEQKKENKKEMKRRGRKKEKRVAHYMENTIQTIQKILSAHKGSNQVVFDEDYIDQIKADIVSWPREMNVKLLGIRKGLTDIFHTDKTIYNVTELSKIVHKYLEENWKT
jgi:hypothetical protein